MSPQPLWVSKDSSLEERSGSNYRRTQIFTNSTCHLNVAFTTTNRNLCFLGIPTGCWAAESESHFTFSPTIRSLLRIHRKHIKLSTPLIHRRWMSNTQWIIEVMVGTNLWRSSNLTFHSKQGLSLTWDDISCDHAQLTRTSPGTSKKPK